MSPYRMCSSRRCSRTAPALARCGISTRRRSKMAKWRCAIGLAGDAPIAVWVPHSVRFGGLTKRGTLMSKGSGTRLARRSCMRGSRRYSCGWAMARVAARPPPRPSSAPTRRSMLAASWKHTMPTPKASERLLLTKPCIRIGRRRSRSSNDSPRRSRTPSAPSPSSRTGARPILARGLPHSKEAMKRRPIGSMSMGSRRIRRMRHCSAADRPRCRRCARSARRATGAALSASTVTPNGRLRACSRSQTCTSTIQARESGARPSPDRRRTMTTRSLWRETWGTRTWPSSSRSVPSRQPSIASSTCRATMTCGSDPRANTRTSLPCLPTQFRNCWRSGSCATSSTWTWVPRASHRQSPSCRSIRGTRTPLTTTIPTPAVPPLTSFASGRCTPTTCGNS